jgi:hypothetical protein
MNNPLTDLWRKTWFYKKYQELSNNYAKSKKIIMVIFVLIVIFILYKMFR